MRAPLARQLNPLCQPWLEVHGRQSECLPRQRSNAAVHRKAEKCSWLGTGPCVIAACVHASAQQKPRQGRRDRCVGHGRGENSGETRAAAGRRQAGLVYGEPRPWPLVSAPTKR